MGKRKSSHKVSKMPRPKLDKVFDCPFCFHNKTVEVLYSKSKASKASLSCRVCTANYETKLTPLTEPIDVYSEWIDECERQNS